MVIEPLERECTREEIEILSAWGGILMYFDGGETFASAEQLSLARNYFAYPIPRRSTCMGQCAVVEISPHTFLPFAHPALMAPSAFALFRENSFPPLGGECSGINQATISPPS